MIPASRGEMGAAGIEARSATLSAGPLSWTRIGWPVAASQNFTSPGRVSESFSFGRLDPEVTSRLPSGVKATDPTWPPCALTVSRSPRKRRRK